MRSSIIAKNTVSNHRGLLSMLKASGKKVTHRVKYSKIGGGYVLVHWNDDSIGLHLWITTWRDLKESKWNEEILKIPKFSLKAKP